MLLPPGHPEPLKGDSRHSDLSGHPIYRWRVLQFEEVWGAMAVDHTELEKHAQVTEEGTGWPCSQGTVTGPASFPSVLI